MDERTDNSCCGVSRQDWGWLLCGAGVTSAISLLLRRERWLADWLIPAGLVGGGLTLLLNERDAGIDEAEARVARELEALDAIARAKVIRRLAARELGLRREPVAEASPGKSVRKKARKKKRKKSSSDSGDDAS